VRFSVSRGSSRGPPLEYPRSLPDGQVDPRPVLDRLREDIQRLIEVVAGIEQAIDLRVIRRSCGRPQPAGRWFPRLTSRSSGALLRRPTQQRRQLCKMSGDMTGFTPGQSIHRHVPSVFTHDIDVGASRMAGPWRWETAALEHR